MLEVDLLHSISCFISFGRNEKNQVWISFKKKKKNEGLNILLPQVISIELLEEQYNNL